ncbi:MAG: dihydrodipicolinate synthase family protein [Acidimicrobiia bacterium]|nr:dihydrodipicolinate synthase family protein [Acidimicrobiia bacterium]
MTDRLTGSFVATITPMNEDYSIDHDGLGALIDFHAEHGASALLIMGSSGEVSMLTQDERHAIVDHAMTHRPADVELWFGCTGATTEATIDFVSQAAAAGADGAIIAAPSYICTSRADIVQFCLDVADASTIPLGFYNNPPRVGTDLHAEDLVRIAAHPMIQVLKESTTRVGQVAQMAAAAPDISLMCCCNPNLGLVVPTMSLGGHGLANMSGNIIPSELAVMATPWTEPGQDEAFREMYLQCLPMLEFVYSAVNPVPVKTFLRAVGMPAGPMRRPLQPLDADGLERGLAIARKLDLGSRYGYRL